MDNLPAGLAGCPIIVGGGLAGLMTALRLAPEKVILLAKTPLTEGAASAWAQGGIAAALGQDDEPALHAADTLASGDGLVDPAIAGRIAAAAPAAVAELEQYGVVFDRDAEGRLALGLEAAHGRRRIAHVTGDGTGAAIMQAIVAAVRNTPSITVIEGLEARRLLVADGAIVGVLAAGPRSACVLASRRIVLATGGLGGLFAPTTNPLGPIGHGAPAAAPARAALIDMEFVQFHPTALDVGLDPMPLVSEAVRGEGAILVDEAGTRFMAGEGRAELEPRDVVARAVARHLADGHRVFLDTRSALGVDFAAHFPGIAARCRAAGLDPAAVPIPGAAGGPLPHGRHRRRYGGPEHARGAVGMRRGGVDGAARGEPPRQQLAARSCGLRRLGCRKRRRDRRRAVASAAADGAARGGRRRPDPSTPCRGAGRDARPRRDRSGDHPARAARLRRWAGSRSGGGGTPHCYGGAAPPGEPPRPLAPRISPSRTRDRP